MLDPTWSLGRDNLENHVEGIANDLFEEDRLALLPTEELVVDPDEVLCF